MSGYRRDLELAPGAQFRLRRRLWARALSIFGVGGGLVLGVYDLSVGYLATGAMMLALAFAFLVQHVRAELEEWRFEGDAAVRTRFVLRQFSLEETRVPAAAVRGVQVEFVGRRARAWIETKRGEEIPLVEGDSAEVELIADRLTASLKLSSKPPPSTLLH